MLDVNFDRSRQEAAGVERSRGGQVIRSEFFHVCIVVPEIEVARAHLGELLGVEWGPLREFDFPYRQQDGTDTVAVGFKLCYSLAAPHLELVNAMPGTPWECNDYSNLHHIGYLVDDMDAGSQHLTAHACPLGASGVDPTSDALGWAYHRDPLGLRLEIIDAAASGSMGRRMLGGTNQFDAPLTAPF
jgi:Glyoxalase/Bleomycin resistance protein/Dioxygenase superfamily